jgi:hypothetical protein
MRFLLVVAAAAAFACSGASAQNATAEPNYGKAALSAGFAGDPYAVAITAGGSIDATSLGGSCLGSISNAPDFELTYTPGTLPLYLSAVSDRDVSLIVNLPDGSWSCDDDSAGNYNPGLTFYSPKSGVYDIWVGDLSEASPAATLYISELGYQGGNGGGAITNGVTLGADPYYGSVTLASGFTGDPYSVSLSAGGSNDAASVAVGCTGMVGGPPDFNLYYTAGGGLPLYISASSGDDLTLLVNGPDGRWYCDDDSGANPLDPGLSWAKPQSGAYNIWVGRLSTSDLVDATLYISEVDFYAAAGNDAAAGGIDVGAAPVYGDVTLSSGFTPDPHVVNVTPGGNNDAATVNSACSGMVGSAPDVDLYFTAGNLPLYVFADSADDTTLLINTPNGDWICDDDSALGLNPGVVFKAPASGLYDIWVGRFGDASGSATLNISELPFEAD